jgi:drug/metabolite transporter (DMT)-like permease
MPKQNIKLAAFFMITSSVAIALMTAFVKDMSCSFSTQILIFYRFLAPLLITLIIFLIFRNVGDLKTPVLGLHFLRALAMVLGSYALFFTLRHLPLTETNLLWNTAPLIIPVLAWIFLGEKPGEKAWLALLISTIGVLLILKPGHELFNPVALIGLSAGFAVAVSLTTLRKLAQIEPTNRCVFYFLFLSALIAFIPVALFGWETPAQAYYCGISGLALVELFLLVGITAWMVQYFRTLANSMAPAAIIGPFIYITIPVSLLIDWFYWQHIPDFFTLIGAVLLFVGAMIITRGK